MLLVDQGGHISLFPLLDQEIADHGHIVEGDMGQFFEQSAVSLGIDQFVDDPVLDILIGRQGAGIQIGQAGVLYVELMDAVTDLG